KSKKKKKTSSYIIKIISRTDFRVYLLIFLAIALLGYVVYSLYPTSQPQTPSTPPSLLSGAIGQDIFRKAECVLYPGKHGLDKMEMDAIEHLIDSDFERRCESINEVSFEIFAPCNFDIIYHYATAKHFLRSTSPEENQKLISLLANTYNLHRMRLAQEPLSLRSNRLTEILLAMHYLGLLNASEEEFWIDHYSRFTIDRSQLIFPQQWDVIWFFYKMGFNTSQDLHLPNNTICNYLPTLDASIKENFMKEPSNVMMNKLVIMRAFCNQPLHVAECEGLRNYPGYKHGTMMSCNNEYFNETYEYLLKISDNCEKLP
ncbi:MAG TPA: hypothetical protein VJB12_00040, partial [Candidatus Nanoarchaeia archaeon]|nr:hypothetical protein [Candidatus Nanoarchaeia archaeon]